MASLTAPQLLPDTEHEYHTVVVDNSNVPNSEKPKFTVFLPIVLENIVQAKLVAGNFSSINGSSPIINLNIEQLNTQFSQYAKDTLSSTNQIKLQNLFGSLITDNSTSFSFKDNYPIVQQYNNPIRKLDRLSIQLLNPAGAEQSVGNVYLIFKFVCKKRNLSLQ
jgi:hypothetical protein